MPTVAVSSEFFTAFAKLPRRTQRRVEQFTESFRENPTSAGINYEKISCSKDPKVRTVRVGRDYRAIVLQPDEGDVYVLVWVDHHDEAMEWTRDRVFEINPRTGALQVVSAQVAERVVRAEAPSAPPPQALLDGLDDEQLVSFGLPEILLPAARAVRSAEQLLALTKHLPEEAAEALMWLGEGIPPEEVREAVRPKRAVDTRDFGKALEHPDSRRRFVTIKSSEELSQMLQAPLAKWRVFLHPSQEQLVGRSFNGPAQVLGGPGTGKTVVAMHRAKHLVEHVFTDPSDRVLLTTFTANLAQDLEQHLRTLFGGEPKRIDAVNIHAWAMRFLNERGFQFSMIDGKFAERCWQRAVEKSGISDWEIGFLQQEWKEVVQSQAIDTREAYLKAPRVGRGTSLSRGQRDRAWTIFEAYRDQLRARGQHEWLDLIMATRRYLERHPEERPYRAVVVDEAQDFHEQEWQLLRTLAPRGSNDLFIVGDAHQRIYGRPMKLSGCGVQIRGRSSRLRINYRTTEQIRNWAMALLQGTTVDDLDGGQAQTNGYRSLLSGRDPIVRHFADQHDERQFLLETLGQLLQERKPEDICLVARKESLLTECYEPLFQQLGVRLVKLRRDSDGGGSGVRLANMHRIKGLEFPCVLIAGVNDGILPNPRKLPDSIAEAEHLARERALLFVAATRARDQLVVTSWGKPSSFLTHLSSDFMDQ